MSGIADDNAGFVECWNEILTPKWIRFRHLLCSNGKIHSDIAYDDFGIREGDKVLDIGCGFGETALEIAQHLLGGSQRGRASPPSASGR
jgi:tRNA G46 methylase TrmB